MGIGPKPSVEADGEFLAHLPRPLCHHSPFLPLSYQVKLFCLVLANQSPESIWAIIGGQWVIDGAFVILVSTIYWWIVEIYTDNDILKNCEAAAIEAENGSDPKAKKLGHGFLMQTCKKLPVCRKRQVAHLVCLHYSDKQAEESFESTLSISSRQHYHRDSTEVAPAAGLTVTSPS